MPVVHPRMPTWSEKKGDEKCGHARKKKQVDFHEQIP